MMSPLRTAILGGAAVLALSVASAAVAGTSTTSTTTTSPDGKIQRIMVVRGDDEGDSMLDLAGGAPAGDDRGPGMHRHGGDPERMAKHLRDVLQLTPAQEPALQAFLTAMHPPHAGGPGDHMPGMHEHGPMPSDPAARKAEMDKRMADMKTRMADMEKTRAEEAALTTPQRLDMMVRKMAERSAQRQAEMQAHVAAVKQFYAALTPSQQKAFDALHGGEMMGGRMEHGRGMMRMRMGMEMAPPMPPMPPLPPLAMRAPLPPLPPLPPAPPEPN